jgi:plastocyanin
MRTRLTICTLVALGAVGIAAPLASGSKIVKNVSLTDYVGFKPKTLTISKGSAVKVTWSQGDLQPHNVTLMKAPAGIKQRDFTSTTGIHHKPFERTFKKAGTYKFECTVHPYMTLKVVVR